MEVMKLILIVLFCFFSLCGSAQSGKRYISTTNPSIVDFGLCYQNKFEVLDTMDLYVVYDFNLQQDSLSTYVHRNRMILELGHKYSKYYSLLKFLNDKLYTLSLQGKTISENLRSQQRDSGNGGESLSAVVICDNLQDRLIVSQFIPFSSDQTITYSEPIPRIDWTISDESDSLLDYKCYKATTFFRGRHYIAWFTPDIPVNVGPWKFTGLPGLILKIRDDKNFFQWTCIAIEQKKEPIIRFIYPTQNSTREKYLQYERQYHESPKSILGRGGAVVFRVWDKTTKTGKELDESWTIPYNPIERE